ncbi:hypothetical protein DFH06DRAFT_616047 [Mycena polygramma]|nr:hypothetical protein DFH06DRAFT_616047 [Mycena polygramma]
MEEGKGKEGNGGWKVRVFALCFSGGSARKRTQTRRWGGESGREWEVGCTRMVKLSPVRAGRCVDGTERKMEGGWKADGHAMTEYPERQRARVVIHRSSAPRTILSGSTTVPTSSSSALASVSHAPLASAQCCYAPHARHVPALVLDPQKSRCPPARPPFVYILAVDRRHCHCNADSDALRVAHQPHTLPARRSLFACLLSAYHGPVVVPAQMQI